MEYFNKEQIERLKPAEQHFTTVVYRQYKLATTSVMNNMVADTYEECTGKTLKRNFSCTRCCYNVYKEVGTLYFKSIEHINEQKKENKEEQPQTTKKKTKITKKTK